MFIFGKFTVIQPDVDFSFGSPISPSHKTLFKQFGNGQNLSQNFWLRDGEREFMRPIKRG